MAIAISMDASASAWVTPKKAAAPSRTRELICPVRPKTCFAIMNSPPANGVSQGWSNFPSAFTGKLCHKIKYGHLNSGSIDRYRKRGINFTRPVPPEYPLLHFSPSTAPAPDGLTGALQPDHCQG